MGRSRLGDESRSLQALFDPRSVVVIGASQREHKWGYRLSLSALRGREQRSVYLVSRSGGSILGTRVHRSVSELPEAPELAVVAVPVDEFDRVVDDALRNGVRAVIGITAGLGEKGGTNAIAERAIASRIRAAGAVLVGPNSAGLADSSSGLRIEFSERPVGSVGLVSQSGNLIQEMAQLFAPVGLGFSTYVSIGNQADLVASDFVDHLARDEATTSIACYVEDFKDGRAFIDAIGRAVAGGKPVAVLSAGRSLAGSRSALSHTGALVSDDRVVTAACRAAGAHLVRTPSELVDVLQAWGTARRSTGRRVAIVGDGGGLCSIAADTLSAARLDVPPFSEELAEQLASVLPAAASTVNPVDLAGAAEIDLDIFEHVLGLLLRASEIDAVLLTGYFGGYGAFSAERQLHESAAARAIAVQAQQAERPLVVHTIHPSSSVAGVLRTAGVPVFQRIESAARALDSLAPPAPAAPPNGARARSPDSETGGRTVDALSYFESQALVGEAGVELARAFPAGDVGEALAAGNRLGYPVVLKALRQSHKSEGGGVVTGIGDESELAEAFSTLAGSGPAGDYSVEEMVPVASGIEMIVGLRRDPTFGVVLLIGFGGVLAEVVDDVVVTVSPTLSGEIERVVGELRCGPLLMGARGRPPLDLEALARTVRSLADQLSRRTDILEIELNPLLLLPQGAVALDARVILTPTREGLPPAHVPVDDDQPALSRTATADGAASVVSGPLTSERKRLH